MPGGKNSRSSDVSKEDFVNLKEKFQLLEGDRKAYFETFEQRKKQNEIQIKELRSKNKELRNAIAELKHQNSRSMDSDTEIQAEMSKVQRLRAEYDTRVNKTRMQKKELASLRDTLKDFQLDATRPNLEENPLTRKIRMLENRLDKAMIKFNEAQSIRKTYEQIVKRLKDERVGFDNQLQAIERALAAKTHDHEEMLLLAGDATHAKDLAHQDLEKCKLTYQKNQNQRLKELKDREAMVKQKEELNMLRKERDKNRLEILARQSGDKSEEQENALKQALVANRLQEGIISRELEECKKDLDVYENAFRKIKEATGVSDINEVMQKIMSQEDTAKNLKQLTLENASTLKKYEAEKAELKKIVDDIRYEGTGARSGSRKQVDRLEEQITQSQSRLDRCKQKYERLHRTLVDVQAGVEHLVLKLSNVEIVGDKDRLADGASVVEMVYHCERTLVQMLGQLQNTQDTDKLLARVTSMDVQLVREMPFNRRINLPSMFEDDGAHTLDEDPYVGGEDELSREMMKKEARDLVEQKTATAQKKKKKRRKGGLKPGREAESRRMGGKTLAARQII